MPVMRVTTEGDGVWTDLADRIDDVITLDEGSVIQVAALPGGMKSGRTSVTLRLDLPDGNVVIAETSLFLFLAAAEILRARYGGEP